MTKTAQQLVDEANAEIETITAEQAIQEMTDPDVVMVDLRDIRELQHEDMVENAFHMPREMLEFWVDSESPYHKPVFSSNKRFIFYCSLGWRSALAVKAARQVGLENLCHVVNKVGTFQSAVAAQYHGIPYFPIAWGLDENSRTKEDISIEVHDAEEIRRCMGQTRTLDSIDAYYLAFDITRPELVAGVISTQGVLSPYNLVGASL